MKRKEKILSIVISLIIIITLLGCSKRNQTIKIATKPMTEQFILGEMLKLLIEENTDLKVQITKGIGGGTSNIHPAIVKGDFDLYSEYTGTGWNFVLKENGILDNDELYKELKEKYEDKYNLKWMGLYGFNNTYGLVIRKDISDKYNIKTYSDLAANSDKLIFGAEYDFYEREDGFNALCEKYKLNFKESIDLDIGLKYKAINAKEIDVMNVFTTDGQLADADVVLLKDDKNFYETYYCGTVVRNDVLKEHPELEKALMKMDNIISEKEMAELNNKVDLKNKDEKTVAKEFLENKGLIEK